MLARIRSFLTNLGFLGRALLFVGGAAAISLLIYREGPLEDVSDISNNLVFLVLINLVIAVICILLFLIGRNVVKLVFDRKNKILGSKLRSRLTVAFVTLSMVPTVILFVLASGALTGTIDGWFKQEVQKTVEGSISVARQYFNTMEKDTLHFATTIEKNLLSRKSKQDLKVFLQQQRKQFNLYSITVVRSDREKTSRTANAADSLVDFREPELNEEALSRLKQKKKFVLLEESGSSQFLRAYIEVDFSGETAALVVTKRIPPEVSAAMGEVVDTYEEYKRLQFYEQPLRSSYILTLTMITGLILFGAIWFGLYLAREITGPIQRLAEGTREIAKGNYDFEIQTVSDDELGFLEQSFNTMTRDLKLSLDELERRKGYIEALLSNLAVGVVAINLQDTVTLMNEAARRQFNVASEKTITGIALSKALEDHQYQQLKELSDIARARTRDDRDSKARAEMSMTIVNEGRERRLASSADTILDSQGNQIGLVFIFDDITDLAKAQQMSAWREVARRIAHEIKNPLTPIKLSAQRLAKQFSQNEKADFVLECTDTIVEHVDSIKRLVNEFSNLAKMPTVEFTSTCLNEILSDTVATFAETNPEVTFQLIPGSDVPNAQFDKEQVRRLVFNLIENAIGAFQYDEKRPRDHIPRIVVRSRYVRRRQTVQFEISDNGPGFSAAIKPRIFEPYFTTKETGTGLGLAIVNTIVSDHQGEIRVFDNTPRGAKFVVDLPEAPSVANISVVA